MEYQETQQSQLYELGQWQELIHSDSWKVFVKLLKTHQIYLQDKVNGYLEKHEDRKAGEELAKLKDSEKLLRLVTARIAELRNKTGGTNNGNN